MCVCVCVCACVCVCSHKEKELHALLCHWGTTWMMVQYFSTEIQHKLVQYAVCCVAPPTHFLLSRPE